MTRAVLFRRFLAPAVLLGVGASAGWAAAAKNASARVPAENNWQTATVVRTDIHASVLATGVVRPQVGAQVAVGSRISGVLERLHVRVGERVRAGQLLAELNSAELQSQLERAEAALLAARAELVYAESALERVQQLVSRGAAPPVELEEAERFAGTTRAREREAAAAMRTATVQLGYTRIHAPIDGVVGSIATQVGETVAAGFAAPTFLTIVDLGRLEVWAYVDETDIGRIAAGQRVVFTVDAHPDVEFEGAIVAIRPTAEIRENVVNYVTLIEVQSSGEEVLRPEMTATVTVMLDSRGDLVAVPNRALRRDSEGAYVLVQGAQGFVRRPVRLGFRGSDHSEVVSGLTEGEHVIVGEVQGCEAGT